MADKQEKKYPTADAPQAAPESVKAPGTGVDEGRQASGAVLPEDRVPGVQYPASSNQLSEEDIEALEKANPQAQFDREQAEKVAEVDEDNADVLAAAAESGNADVQNLLGHRAVASQNRDVAGVRAVDEKLRELLNK